jgi:LPXTG-motif cell wall-anchored protein
MQVTEREQLQGLQYSQAMTFRRITIAAMFALLALALLAPAAALATGPSAGDQQYVDPLGGQNGSSGSNGSNGSSGGGGSTSSGGGGSSGASASSGSSGTFSASSGTSSTTSSSTASTGTTAGDPTGATSAGSLPRTGYDVWLAVGLGIGLLGAGVLVRRRVLES